MYMQLKVERSLFNWKHSYFTEDSFRTKLSLGSTDRLV